MYLLTGWCGYYDEGHDWPIGLFHNKETAELFGIRVKEISALHMEIVNKEFDLPYEGTEDEFDKARRALDAEYAALKEKYGDYYQGEVWGVHVHPLKVLG